MYAKGDVIREQFIVHEVIEGGAGLVYLCININELNFVALKTLKPRATQQHRQDFKRSAIVAIRLGKHPNIVWHQDFFEEGNTPFLQMEWVPGEKDRGSELSDWLKHGALETKTALGFAIDIAEGMKYARNRSIRVHRDLKPENVLIGAGPVAKIADFGMSLSNDSTLLVKVGLGTFSYMAPEQWIMDSSADLSQLDERTDIYALGCILYEMLTGRKPFIGNHIDDIRNKHLNDPVVFDPVTVVLQKDLQAIILKMMEKSPDARYQTFEVLQAELVDLFECIFSERPVFHVPIPLDVEDHYNRAFLFLRVDRYADAIKEFDRAIQLSPSGLLYAHRANAYLYEDNKEQGICDIEQSLVLDPDDTTVLYLAGLFYRMIESYEQAIIYLQKALDNDVNARSNLALAQAGLNQYADAISSLTRVLNQGMESASIYLLRGIFYRNMDRYDDAVRDYTRALGFDVNNIRAYIERGQSYLTLDKYKEALADFERAVRIDPNHAEAYAYLAHAYKRLDLYHEALENIQLALEFGYKGTRPYRDRGDIYMYARMYKESLESIDFALEIEPDDADLHLYRGRVLERMKRNEDALNSYNRVVELEPHGKQGYAARALFYAKQKERYLALTDINKALSIDMKDYELYFIRGNILLGLEQYSDAVSSYSTVLAIRVLASAYNNRGIAQLHMDRLGEALTDFRFALKLYPYMTATYLNMGMVHEAQGNIPMAVQEYAVVANLGNPAGIERLRKLAARYRLNIILPHDPFDKIRDSVINAESLEAMRLAVRRFPYMLDEEFDEAYMQIFTTEEQRMLEMVGKLYWLRIAIAELLM